VVIGDIRIASLPVGHLVQRRIVHLYTPQALRVCEDSAWKPREGPQAVVDSGLGRAYP
jgi:hypothetical protein